LIATIKVSSSDRSKNWLVESGSGLQSCTSLVVMDSRDERTSKQVRSENAGEMTRTIADNQQQVPADDVTMSGDKTGSSCSDESPDDAFESHQQSLSERGQDDTPRSQQIFSPITVELASYSASVEKPTSQQTSSSSLTSSEPLRILPLTKYSEKMRMRMSGDVRETSESVAAASASSVALCKTSLSPSPPIHTGQLSLAISPWVEGSSSVALSGSAATASRDMSSSSSLIHHTPTTATLQHDVQYWPFAAGIHHHHQQLQQPTSSSILPTCSGVFTPSFTTKLSLKESDRPEVMSSSLDRFFSSDSAAATTTGRASAVFVQSPTSAVQSTIALSDFCGLGLLSSSFSGDDNFPVSHHEEEWRRAERPPDFLELKLASGKSADVFPRSSYPPPAAHLFYDEGDICVFSAGASSPGELESAGARSSSPSSSSTQISAPAQFAGALTKSELVEPLLSLHIDDNNNKNDDNDDDNGEGQRGRRTSGHGKTTATGARRTHPGCSTLRYNRKHNPGLHRPRAYRCDTPGQSTSNTIMAHSHQRRRRDIIQRLS